MEYPRQTNNLIATLRGLPEDRSVAKLRPAFQLAALIEVLEQRYKIGQEKVEDLLAKHWMELVGEHAAHRSCPQKIVGGSILLVRVANPMLRANLEFEKQKILDRIHKLPGGGAIKALNFRAG
ncbi:MAG TPA: DUF721 domain-containing protein [Opitutales bacterium]|nr:DUF721 domain-containing protein [Opitutales bacterium]